MAVSGILEAAVRHHQPHAVRGRGSDLCGKVPNVLRVIEIARPIVSIRNGKSALRLWAFLTSRHDPIYLPVAVVVVTFERNTPPPALRAQVPTPEKVPR
jgi:hypothetical protein